MNTSQGWWQVIQESLQQQNWPVAEGALRRLLEVNPDHLELLDLFGYSLLMQARYSESEWVMRPEFVCISRTKSLIPFS